MNSILTIAKNSFKESIRNRLFLNLLVFAIAMIILSLIIGTLSLGAEKRITMDIGLGAITIFGTLIAIFIGVSSFVHEIERRTIYTILARPVNRTQFILGKYLGIMMVLAVNTIAMAILVSLVLLMLGQPPTLLFWLAVIMQLLALGVIAALAIGFATISGTVVAVIATLTIWISGTLTDDLLYLARRADNPLVTGITEVLYYILPDLSSFSLHTQVANDLAIPAGFISTALIYGLSYIAIVLALAAINFNRRELV